MRVQFESKLLHNKGGGGSGLPARTIAPTYTGNAFRGGGGSITTVSSAGQLIGDTMVGIGQLWGISISSLTGPTLTNQSAGEFTHAFREEDESLWRGGSVGWPYSHVAGVIEATADGVAQTTTLGTVTGSGIGTTVAHLGFSGAANSLILIGEGEFGVDAGWNVDGNNFEFPDYLVPDGYQFIYVGAMGDDHGSSNSWVNATEVLDFNNGTGIDGALTVAFGSNGEGVRMVSSASRSDYDAGRVMLGAYYALPGVV